MQEQGQQLEAQQRELLEAQMQAQIRALQQGAAAQLPAQYRTGSPLSNVSPAMRDAMTSAQSGDWIKLAAVGGIALVLGALLMRG